MQAGPPDAKTGVQKAEDAEEELRRKSTQVMMLVLVMTLWITTQVMMLVIVMVLVMTLWITRFTFS